MHSRDNKPRPFAHPSFTGRIGVARQDITPPVGIYARNWGAAIHDTAEGIHRPLTATTVTLRASEAGESPLVLLGLDLGWWRTVEDEAEVRGGLIAALSLDPARVLLPFSHTHSGPSLCREDRHRPGGHLVAGYLDRLREAVIATVRQALASETEATLTWNTGRCALATNRDLPDPDAPRFVCGFNPDRHADDTLLVGRITDDADGRVLGTLVNYACHPVTLAWENRLISPDYVGALRETVEANTGNAPCLFLMGASGELAPREQYTADTAIADAHGHQAGFAALAALAGMLPPRTQLRYARVVESGAPLAVWERVPAAPSSKLAARRGAVEIPLKSDLPTIAEIERQMQAVAASDPVQAERLARKRRVRRIVGDGSAMDLPFWAWRVGDALLVATPTEAYSLLQTELRRRFPRQAVIVMNLVNGASGYLPPEELYAHDLYPVWQTPFAAGGLERVIEACAGAMGDLTADGE